MKCLKLALALVVLFAGSALCQTTYYRHSSDVRNIKGDAIGGAKVQVYIADSSTLATIFSDPAGASSQSNPLYTDTQGMFHFYAVAGAYDLTISRSGIVTYTLEDVLLHSPSSSTLSVTGIGVEDLKYKVGTYERTDYGNPPGTVTRTGLTPINVLSYGVDNTGATDCSDSLQAVIDSVAAWGKGTVYCPTGIYLLETGHGLAGAPYGANQSLLVPRSGVSIVGDGPGTIFRAGSGLNASDGFAIFDSRDATNQYDVTAVSDVVFADFTIDFNGANNPQQSGLGSYNHNNKGIAIYTGSNITIRNVSFLDNVGTNSIFIGSPSAAGDTAMVKNVLVENCYFYKLARDTEQTDHSAIYVIADDATIVNNVIKNTPTALHSSHTVAAMDVHGSRVSVIGNTVENVTTGLYIGGVVDAFGYTASGNVLHNVGIGISLWRDSPAEMNNIIISGNSITVDPPGPNFKDGILVAHGEHGVNDITISGNSIYCDDPTSQAAARGITFVYNATNVSIVGNTISGFPRQGIHFYPDQSDSVTTQGLEGVVVSHNIVKNCGMNTASGTAHRAGINVGGTSAGENNDVSVIYNTVIDTFATHRMSYGVAVYGEGDNYKVYGNVVDGALLQDYAINDHTMTGHSGWSDDWLDTMLPTGEPFYVTLYGATGDGSTDDTATIQAAIDAAEAAGGGGVYFPWTSNSYSSSGNSTTDADVLLFGPGLPDSIPGGAPRFAYGSGSPEGVKAMPIGSVFGRVDGAADTAVYVKESGTSDTGWTAICGETVYVYASIDSAAATTVTTASTYYPIAGTFTNDPMVGFIFDTDHIEYTGVATRDFEIDWHASFSASNASTTVNIGVEVNSVTTAQETMGILCKSAGEEYAMSGTVVAELATNGEIQLVLTADGDGDIITVNHFTTTIRSVK